ncbi:uncharacterized protein LOC131206155 [Anopheles bellator]|uniref:uncharacterized protein LOC131206155 n=1 Tax=Anopheles bellator TaxID=139047 RepID=UPI00264918E9|nr:uncharacterized protein LOC131206155 [Anopheles bellator]
MPPVAQYQSHLERRAAGHAMDPEFVRFIKFNGYLLATLICYHTFVQAFGLPPRLQQWYQCPGGQSWFGRDHPVVDGVLLLCWITAVASLYQALKLEVVAMLRPIGYLLSLKVLLVVVQDMVSTWNDDAEERYLRNAQDVLAWSAFLVYFYYTLYTLKHLFRRQDHRQPGLQSIETLASSVEVKPCYSPMPAV